MKKHIDFLVVVILIGIMLSACSLSVGKTDATEPIYTESKIDVPDEEGKIQHSELAENQGSDELSYADSIDLEENVGDASVEIIIEKVNRSTDYEYEGESKTRLYYYEMALLPESIKNSKIINESIKNYKDKFFSDEEHNPSNYPDTPYGENYDYVSIESVYLDEQYYSINMNEHVFFGGLTDFNGFRGYTYDLETGEEVSLAEILHLSEDDLCELIRNRLLELKLGFEFLEIPDQNEFISNEYWNSYHYCIDQDGRIYLLYDKYQIGSGPMGSVEIYLTKVDVSNTIQYQINNSVETAPHMIFFSNKHLDGLREDLHIPDDEEIYPVQKKAYQLKENDQYVVPVFYIRRHENDYDDVAEVNLDIDTGEIVDDLYLYDLLEK